MTRCEKANRQTRAQVVVTCGCVKFKDTIIESHPISLPPESISILSIALAILIPTKCLFPRFWNILHSKRDLKTTHNAIRGCALLCFCFFMCDLPTNCCMHSCFSRSSSSRISEFLDYDIAFVLKIFFDFFFLDNITVQDIIIQSNLVLWTELIT